MNWQPQSTGDNCWCKNSMALEIVALQQAVQ